MNKATRRTSKNGEPQENTKMLVLILWYRRKNDDTGNMRGPIAGPVEAQ
jgi:hypothetical protein